MPRWVLWGILLVALLAMARKLLPRGVRSNNPLNVGPVPGGWQGQVGTNTTAQDPDPVVEFNTVTNGARAGAIDVLGDYYHDGKLSIGMIMQEYSPRDPGKAAVMAKWLGLTTSEVVPVNRLRDLLHALARHEQGGVFYTRPELDPGFDLGAKYLGVKLP